MRDMSRFDAECKRRQDAALDRRRNRQIKELELTSKRPTILPATKRWIEEQIELLRSGAAAGQGGGHA